MVEYLIPGEMPDAVKEHFTMYGLNSRQRTIRVPAEITGYTVEDTELRCAQFQQATGLTEDFIVRNAHETNVRDLLLIWNRAVTRVNQVSYKGSPRVSRILELIAQEFKRDIATVREQGYCFEGGRYDNCRPHTREDYNEDLIDPICVHFNCAGRRNRGDREALVKLYDYSLDGKGLSRYVRESPLKPISGVIINDTNNQPVAEVDRGVIYILVNIDATEERSNGWDYVNSYWRHNAEVLERILREAIPVAIAQEKEKPDPVEEKRTYLLAGQEEATGLFLSSVAPAIRNRIQTTETQIQQHGNQARQYLEMYLASQVEIEKLQLELRLMQENPHAQDEKLKRELENVLDMPHVVGISFGRRGLEVYTDTLYINWERKRYRIGAFRLDIDFKNGVRIFNYTDPVRNVGQHPHVLNNEGLACFGNVSETVARLLGARELEMLVTVLVEFLQSYNPQYPAAHINPWPVVGKE